MKNSKYIIAGVIAFFAFGLGFSAFSAQDRHDRGSIVIKTDKGRIYLNFKDWGNLGKLKDLKDLKVRIRKGRHGKIDIDLNGLDVSLKKLERSAKRLERKIERKMKKALRSLENVELDFDQDFDFDFDWD